MKNVKRISALIFALCIIVGVFSACSLFSSPEKKLLGAWRDNAGASGYEFLEDNKVKITILDASKLPIIGDLLANDTGTFDGTYTVSKDANKNDIVTISYTILSNTISNTYIFKINDNILTLTDTEDSGNVTIYVRYTADTSSSAAQ